MPGFVVGINIELWVDVEPKNSNFCGKRFVGGLLLEYGILLGSASDMAFNEGISDIGGGNEMKQKVPQIPYLNLGATVWRF